MADISKEIRNFQEAVYGEDVRGSMISLAEKVNEEAENSTDKVAEYSEAEESRVQAETARANAEKARAEAEKGRVSAEASRVSAESARARNEEDRVSAEETRAEAEAARANAEDGRASAETARVTAENKRATAENARATAESGRDTSEQKRVSAEEGRAEAESKRVEAEASRQTDTAQAIEDCDEAAERANAAAEAAEGVVSGTGLVTVQEKGTANGVATLDENTKIPQSQIDGNNIPVTFEQAAQRANIQSGDSLAVAFGKLARFCADLDSHAFAAPVNNLAGTDPSLPLAAPQGAVLKKEVEKLNSALAIMPSTGANDGSSFQKNFYLISSDNGGPNKASYFSVNDANRNKWKNIPTTFPENGVILGYREVFFMDASPHALIKVTELFPVAGRQHFAFYNINSWSGWTALTPE